MDGTQCGSGKWCIDGHCESMSKRRTSKTGVHNNPRNGGKDGEIKDKNRLIFQPISTEKFPPMKE